MTVARQHGGPHNKRVEAIVRVHPGISRHEVAEYLGLGLTTINPIVSKAIDAGRLRERPGARASGSVGRPRGGLYVAGPEASLGGVMWTHGHIQVLVMTYDGRIHHHRTVTVDKVPRSDLVVDLVTEASDYAIEGLAHSRPVVLGLPAPYEHGVGSGQRYHARFAPEADERWFLRAPAAVLSQALRAPLFVENDSNLAALGELHDGAAKDEPVAIYLGLSDRGIGAGLLIDGHLVRGADGFAGEISHARVDHATGAICTCGSRGCLRLQLGPNLVRQLHPAHGEDLDYRGLVAMAESSEPGAVRVLQDAGRAIGVSLAHVVAFLNPSCIVVAAGSTLASQYVVDGITSWMQQSTAPFMMENLSIKAAELGESAVLRGALALGRMRMVIQP